MSVEGWLHDVDDAVASVLVAGIGSPDPDLPDELRELADRGRAHGADGGADRLDALAVALAALADTADREVRVARGGRAFEALQAVVAWGRLFRAELDLIRVAEGLRPAEAAATVEGVTRRLRPVGFELRGDRLSIVCLDLDDHQPSVLVDTLAEVDRLDPLGRPVVSRLFQEVVDLRAVLGAVVELVDHPPTGPGSRVFAPAFSARPRLRPPVDVSLPTVQLDAGSRAGSGPGRAAVTVVLRADRLGLRTPGGVPIAPSASPALRTVLRKLLIREGRPEVPLDVVVQRREHEWTVLSADDRGERAYPAWDPSAFGIPPETLRARVVGEGPVGLWLRTTIGLLGGGGGGAFAAEVAQVDADGEELRLGLAARLLGVERPVSPAWVARALGGDEREVLAALWLGGSAGLWEAVPIEALAHRRQGPVPDGDVPAISVRALLTAMTGEVAEALAFVEAHVAALARAAKDPQIALPEPLDLVLLGEIVARLRGDPDPRVVTPLGLPKERLWRDVVERLQRWTFDGEAHARSAGDALLLAASAGLERWIVG